jgi:isoleucyl-tRNA synthetase
LMGLRYEQLIDWAQPMENADRAFQVIAGDFVTTEDGTGIVHTAPTFGADDARVAAAAGVPPLLVDDGTGEGVPLVDKQGRFIACCGEMAGRYVKDAYYADGEAPERSVDVEIAIELKTRGQAFVVEKYKHSYPHCWRTDKPILYYPMDSWFVRATAAKKRMMELNETIDWKPASTGTGRFGKWLENLNDWNLSRSRFWGIPIPIWRTDDGSSELCIGSVEELIAACEKSVAAGVMSAEDWSANVLSTFVVGDMSSANYDAIDLHKHHMDDIVLVAEDGRPMRREADLIDAWFDSGSMPYAQGHYPFESPERIDNRTAYPADFIAEGVDQTRGWFYTLHAISTMVFDSVAYKAVVSNGLVLDKNGIKMSKRLGNTVDPFETIDKYGPDATRWYMMTNAQPWDNLRFNADGITEVQRKFFGTLHNTYAFFAMYAEIDAFDSGEEQLDYAVRPEMDRWILSRLQTTLNEVREAYASYEPTRAGRAVQRFVVEELSNWYVRQSRRRFWKSSSEDDKLSAYQTLHRCLSDVAVMASPIAPFFSDQLYRDLGAEDSVHLALWPEARAEEQDAALESRMGLAQKLCSMSLALRKKESIRVRQPLARILVPVLTDAQRTEVESVADLVCAEINVKRIELLDPKSGVISKRLKADFKKLGPRYGKQMKALAVAIAGLDNDAIVSLEQSGSLEVELADITATIHLDDVEILANDIPGWTVLTEGALTVALDIEIDESLRSEGLSRELVNRVQNLRKERGFEVTDRILLSLDGPDDFKASVAQNIDYIRAETLADDVQWCAIEGAQVEELEPTLSVSIAVEQSK